LCVYGDNFFQSVKYKLTFLPLNEHCSPAVDSISTIEPALSEKKTQMAEFQKEYMDLKKRFVSEAPSGYPLGICISLRWETAKEKLKKEDEDITKLLKNRDEAYDELYNTCAAPYHIANPAGPTSHAKSSSGGLFSSFFGNGK
jgi:hypothetical protein